MLHTQKEGGIKIGVIKHMNSLSCGIRVILGLSMGETDWASDHKHSAPCEIPASVGAFSSPGAPQPSRGPVMTVSAETTERERGRAERFAVYVAESMMWAATKHTAQENNEQHFHSTVRKCLCWLFTKIKHRAQLMNILLQIIIWCPTAFECLRDKRWWILQLGNWPSVGGKRTTKKKWSFINGKFWKPSRLHLLIDRSLLGKVLMMWAPSNYMVT